MTKTFVRQSVVYVVIFLFLHNCAFSQCPTSNDYVVFRVGNDREREQRLEGEIVNLTGRDGLAFRPNNGQEIKIAIDRIIDYGTVKEPAQINAEQALKNGDYHTAIDNLLEARKSEKRTWMQRQQTSEIVQAYSALGEQDRACREFYALAESDPETVYLAHIPLPWYVDVSQSLAFQQLGEMWLDRPNYPACQLLAAGLSLTTANRVKAVEALQSLAQSNNPSIAALATAQLWRVRLVEATPGEAVSWEQQLNAMPEELRSGPHYLLGEVFARLNQPDNAVTHWLHGPIDTPIMRPLALRSIQRAIKTLESLGRSAEAETLRRLAASDFAF
jgi:tetratricopeptide (TPR) repeat protein